jgi:protein arginine N-methyltransferase 2
MQKAIDKDPKIIYASDIFDRRSALHFAAASVKADAVNAVRWLLAKGITWSASEKGDSLPEDIASKYGNDQSRKFLREWTVGKGELILSLQKRVKGRNVHVNAEYELFYKLES